MISLLRCVGVSFSPICVCSGPLLYMNPVQGSFCTEAGFIANQAHTVTL